MIIPSYPESIPLSLELKDEAADLLSQAFDGVSEFSFPGLWLFRNQYQYRVSRDKTAALIILGTRPAHGSTTGQSFFMTPLAAPERETLASLFAAHDYWKNIPESVFLPHKARFEEWGIEIAEDRDNFDYLYQRTDLAELAGKKFHKKRNLISQFNSLYTASGEALSGERVSHAREVLDAWKEGKDSDGDYAAALDALEHYEELGLSGAVYYVDGEPAAWCLGEQGARGTTFTVHFEKALEKYKGIYQYMNQAFAASLPETVLFINREQDLGEEGLRHAKMSYRPSGFVKKYAGIVRAQAGC